MLHGVFVFYRIKVSGERLLTKVWRKKNGIQTTYVNSVVPFCFCNLKRCFEDLLSQFYSCCRMCEHFLTALSVSLFSLLLFYYFFPVSVDVDDDDVVAQWLVSGTVGDGEKCIGTLLCELHFWGKKQINRKQEIKADVGSFIQQAGLSQRDKSDSLSQNCACFFVFRIRLSYLGIIVCAFPSKTFNTNVSLSTIPIQVRCPWTSQIVCSLPCAPCQSNGACWHFSDFFFTVVKCIIAKLREDVSLWVYTQEQRLPIRMRMCIDLHTY